MNLVAVGLYILCSLLLYGWISCLNEKKAFIANDIKYRYLKVNGNSNLLKATYAIDSLYNLGDASFTKDVVEKEDDLANKFDLSRIASEKKKESRAAKVQTRQ